MEITLIITSVARYNNPDRMEVTGVRQDTTQATVVNNVFRNRPDVTPNRFIEGTTQRMCLWGGSPDPAYSAFDYWDTNWSLVNETHIFEVELLRSESGVNVYWVKRYESQDSRCPEDKRRIYFERDSRQLTAHQISIKANGVRQSPIRTGLQDVDDVLVHLDTVCDNLVPAIIAEIRETRSAIAKLALGPRGMSARAVPGCDAPPIEHERKSHPSHPE